MRNRARLGFVGLVLVCLIAALGPAVSARGGVIGTTPKAEVCNEVGRTVCLTVETFVGITASDSSRDDGDKYTYVQWKIRNFGGTTLTHPTVFASLGEDLCGSARTACDPDDLTTTAAFVDGAFYTVTKNLDGSETETPATNCLLDAGEVECTYPNLAANTGITQFTRVYFKTADLPATATDVDVTAAVKERVNDENECLDETDPNCDTLTVPIRNTYEGVPTEAFTLALNGHRFNLPTFDPTTNGLTASLTFTATSPTNKFTTFQKLDKTLTPGFCFGDFTCYDGVLFADTGGVQTFGSGNPVVFYARLVDPPVPQNKISVIHIYDATSFTLVSNSRIKQTTSTLDFSKMDGVEFKATTFGKGPQKYFIVPGSYDSSNKSFQLSATKGGAVITNLVGTPNVTTGTGNPIRIIGDQSTERSTTLCTTDPQTSLTDAKICVQKISNKVFDSYVWDLGNGWVVH